MRSKTGRNGETTSGDGGGQGNGTVSVRSERSAAGNGGPNGGGTMIDGRELLRVLAAFRRGDFTVRMASDQVGTAGKVADTLNDIIDLNDRMVQEFERLNRVVGKDGRISQRANIGTPPGSWGTCVDSVNGLVADLVQPLTEAGRVIGAVARGDLSQTMTLDVEGRPLKGEFLRTARLVNTM